MPITSPVENGDENDGERFVQRMLEREISPNDIEISFQKKSVSNYTKENNKEHSFILTFNEAKEQKYFIVCKIRAEENEETPELIYGFDISEYTYDSTAPTIGVRTDPTSLGLDSVSSFVLYAASAVAVRLIYS